ncbi:MAG TPA: PadR family transcriptional regulator [Gemmatimonadales bacterium]|jgi:DNA-binding PadR family transcriptional regulator
MTRPRRHALSPLALVILALLDEAPMYPYRMQQLMRDRGTHHVVNVRHRTSLYQTIARLKRDGLIAVQGTNRSENRPERTVYQLTAPGRKAIHDWLRTMLSTPASEFPEFPAALSFIYLFEPPQAREVLAQRAAALDARRQPLADLLREHADAVPRLFLLESEYLTAIVDIELAWVRRVISDIDAGRLTWSAAAIRAGGQAADGGPLE